MKFSVDPWDPTEGIANQLDLEEAESDVYLDVEVPGPSWRPLAIPAAIAVPRVVLFVDGVRRVDARVWLERSDGLAAPAICATYAAGVVRCDRSATVVAATVARGLFSACMEAVDIDTSGAAYRARTSASDRPEALSLALQQAMGELELALAEVACASSDCELLVIDGPLRGRRHLLVGVGYIKTHHVAYLPPEQHAVVSRLAPGQRTPVFRMGTRWSRYSWYLRLPGGEGAPWAGIVRCECSSDLAPAQATRLADASSAALPRFASEAHKDTRAPQNLYPIGGLERELRHRLGDQAILYRNLRQAAALSTRSV